MKQTGSANWDECKQLKVDDSGNVFCTGVFQGKVDFDPGSGTSNLFSAGGNDIYISKIDNGGKLIWAKRMGGKFQDFGIDVKTDKFGNIYSTGAFSDSSDFDPGSGRYKLTSAGYGDAYISKWDDTGKFLWAKRIGGISPDIGRAVEIDGSANVYASGDYSGTVDINPGPGTNNVTGQGIFIVKLTPSGNYIWGRSIQARSTSMKVDESGYIYIGGIFSGTVDLDPGTGVRNFVSKGNWDAFVLKLDSSGNYIWAKQMGGKGYDNCISLLLDKDKIYTTGYFMDTADFDPGAGKYELVPMGGADAFISQLDTTGKFGWAGCISGDSAEQGSGLAADRDGNIYIAGIFYDSAYYNPVNGKPDFVAENKDLSVFILKLDNAGNYKWAQNYGGGDGNYGNQNLGVDQKGNVYCGGVFVGTADFCPGPGIFQITATPPNNSADIYLLKLAQCMPVDTSITITGTTLKANQAVATYQWVDCNKGNQLIPGATNRTYTPVSSGSYAVIISLGECSENSRCYSVNVTGIADLYYGSSDIAVYPNPGAGIFYLELNTLNDFEIEVFNYSGQSVFLSNSDDGRAVIDLSKFSNGLYVVQVKQGKNLIAAQKLLKQ